MLNAKLVIVGGGDARVSEIHLQLPTTIGRSREAKVKLPHPLVSRKHCEVFERDGQLFVRDLGSLNGTYVDSHKIESEQALQPNQLLTLGTVTFRAIYEAADDVSRPGNQDSSEASERPTDRAKFAADEKSIRRPRNPRAEIETENDRATGDTDSHLSALDPNDFLELGAPAKNSAEVASSIFTPDGIASGNGSVSLSEIARLPGAIDPLSFVGGIHPVDGQATQPAPATTALPKINTPNGKAARGKPGKRRPR